MRSLLLSTQVYQQYLDIQLTTKELYISNYVQMEIKRSYLVNIISFYFVLNLDGINTIGDAFALWSNKFKGSELKAILQVIPQLFNDRQLNFSNPKDKEKATSLLALYIKRFNLVIKTKFKNVNDLTSCARALVQMDVDYNNPEPGLKKFLLEFQDTKTCRSQCQIDQFILIHYREEVEQLIKVASQLPRNTNTRGFLNIASNLKEILAMGEKACDCKRCEKIGDAVIALNAPHNLRLEHTDSSFDYMCPTIEQPHYKHPSETQVVMNISNINLENNFND
ncbi:hypothetical protein NIES4071_06370 [Calothrix sp. NIES-4071]|nr:hypothetical protein NIES4071_06370 [Calothrix sp. NIES-4071]BAZ54980.1 hypothetical protein NIES4105_06340 [Calothrix sp. NIES-4105]